MRLRGFDHQTGFNALGAHGDFFHAAVLHGTYPLQVGIKPPFGDIMGMADVTSHHGFFAAYTTHRRHIRNLLHTIRTQVHIKI